MIAARWPESLMCIHDIEPDFCLLSNNVSGIYSHLPTLSSFSIARNDSSAYWLDWIVNMDFLSCVFPVVGSCWLSSIWYLDILERSFRLEIYVLFLVFDRFSHLEEILKSKHQPLNLIYPKRSSYLWTYGFTRIPRQCPNNEKVPPGRSYHLRRYQINQGRRTNPPARAFIGNISSCTDWSLLFLSFTNAWKLRN